MNLGGLAQTAWLNLTLAGETIHQTTSAFGSELDRDVTIDGFWFDHGNILYTVLEDQECSYWYHRSDGGAVDCFLLEGW